MGCTSQPLGERLQRHRKDAQRSGYENNRLYKWMREVGLEKWEILPLLSRTCGKKEAFELERNWLRILKADLNSNLPIREEETIEEYKTNWFKNNEAVRQYQAEYYKANRVAIHKYQAEYYKANKKFQEYYKANREAIRENKAEYYNANRETFREYRVEYYKANREAVLEYNAEYYKANWEKVLQQQAEYYRKNIQTKRYYCDVCDLACRSNRDLKNHLDTLKHSYAWLNAID